MEAQEMPMEETQNVGYIPQMQMQNESILSKHLDASKVLIQLKMMLMNKEYDDENDEWKDCTTTVIDSNGKKQVMILPPLMEPQEVNMVVGYLQSFLNSNTFLSKVKDDKINEIMWGVNKALTKLFYRLRHKLSPDVRDLLWDMIDNSILMGLSRAEGKITLDALSKMQQSIEHIDQNPKDATQKDKEFKVFGF